MSMDVDQKTLLEQAQKIIKASALILEDKKLLTDRILYMPPQALQAFVQFTLQDPSLLEEIIKSLKLKLDAKDNPAKMDEVLKQERTEILDALN